jgi:hypothetical protein
MNEAEQWTREIYTSKLIDIHIYTHAYMHIKELTRRTNQFYHLCAFQQSDKMQLDK